MGHLQLVAEEAVQWQNEPAHPGKEHHRPAECGDLPFLIKRDGQWFYRGSRIARQELVLLFASVLRREDDGSYWLVTPAERGRIEVEDAPFVALKLDVSEGGEDHVLLFTTNLGQVIRVDGDHPIRHLNGLAYVVVHKGNVPQYPVEARLADEVLYKLRDFVEMHGSELGIWSGGTFFPLPGIIPPQVNLSPRSYLSWHSGRGSKVSDGAALEDAAEKFLQISRNAARTADEILQSARTHNEKIATVNEEIASKMAEMNARQTAW